MMHFLKVDGTGAKYGILPCAGYASRVQQGEATFGKYPENLLHSRVRYSKAYKVGLLDSSCFWGTHKAYLRADQWISPFQ